MNDNFNEFFDCTRLQANVFYRLVFRSIVALFFLTVTSACDSGLKDMTPQKNEVVRSPSDCDFWGDYAVTILENYQAQKASGMDKPLEKTKFWITYSSAELGSPAKGYFDKVLSAAQAELAAEEVRRVGISVCLRYTEDQMDSANFYDVIE